jgi:hypothetical protein
VGKKPKEVEAMMLVQTIDFYEGTFKIPADPCPAYWHPRARMVQVCAEMDPVALNLLIEEAKEWGWVYNPYTKTFTRE